MKRLPAVLFVVAALALILTAYDSTTAVEADRTTVSTPAGNMLTAKGARSSR